MTNAFKKIGFVFLVGMSIISCKINQKVRSDKNISVELDSVFINVYEVGRYEDVPYIFFYYQIENKSSDTLHVSMRVRARDPKVPDYKSYCVYKEDTLEIFAGNFTPGLFSIEPEGRKAVDFNLDTNDLMDLIDKYRFENITDQDILRDIASGGVNYFKWRDIVIKESGRRRIVFRNVNDSSMMVWK